MNCCCFLRWFLWFIRLEFSVKYVCLLNIKSSMSNFFGTGCRELSILQIRAGWCENNSFVVWIWWQSRYFAEMGRPQNLSSVAQWHVHTARMQGYSSVFARIGIYPAIKQGGKGSSVQEISSFVLLRHISLLLCQILCQNGKSSKQKLEKCFITSSARLKILCVALGPVHF